MLDSGYKNVVRAMSHNEQILRHYELGKLEEQGKLTFGETLEWIELDFQLGFSAYNLYISRIVDASNKREKGLL